MAPLSILISGCGIAGPVLAYWLLRADPAHRITLVERDAELRLTGQSVDIRQAAVGIIQRMHLEATIREHVTHEAGIEFVDDSGRTLGKFGATGDTSQQSITSEFEIFRGELAKIFIDSVKDRVELVLGEYVASFDDTGDKVSVKFANGRAPAKYDVLVAADGASSRIRNQALGTMEDRRKHLKPLYNYCTYFTAHDRDFLNGSPYAKICNTDRGRMTFIRPDTVPGQCRVNLIRTALRTDDATNKVYLTALEQGSDAVKVLFAKEFSDGTWLVPEIIESMKNSPDFYASETVQVQAPKLAVGRVVFMGDAGYAPTPITGMGTSLAIIGAYVLAGEISKVATEDSDVVTALQHYESILLPYSRSVQKLPPGAPQILNPQSKWGVTVARTLIGFMSRSGLAAAIAWISGATAFQKGEWKLPNYAWD